MPAPASPLVIVNPAANMGRGAQLETRVRATLDANGIAARVVETTAAGHAEELAAEAAAQGHDRVVAVGGDGTMQEVVNGLMADPPPGIRAGARSASTMRRRAVPSANHGASCTRGGWKTIHAAAPARTSP